MPDTPAYGVTWRRRDSGEMIAQSDFVWRHLDDAMEHGRHHPVDCNSQGHAILMFPSDNPADVHSIHEMVGEIDKRNEDAVMTVSADDGSDDLDELLGMTVEEDENAPHDTTIIGSNTTHDPIVIGSCSYDPPAFSQEVQDRMEGDS